MKKLLIFSYLFLIYYINFTILSNEQDQEITKIENNTNDNNNSDTYDIDIEKLFEIDDLPKPKLQEPSFFKVWFRTYGLALLYKFYDFKIWIVKKYKRLISQIKKSDTK